MTPSSRRSRPVLKRLSAGAGALAVALLCLATTADSSRAAACTPPVTNPVACENTQPGANPNTWQIDGAGDPSIQGYATAMSVNKGQTIGFKIKAASSNYQIDILRLGYYGGNGARVMASGLAPTGTSTQPPCATFSATGLIDCGNWSVSRSWTVPTTAVSGVYIAHLKPSTGDGSHIVFVVRDDASTSDVVLQTSDATWQAYNTYGGNSTYSCTVACPPGDPLAYKGAYKVSYNRPFNTGADDSGRSWLFTGGEYTMIRFLEASGYNLSYLSSVDVHRRGTLLLNHDLFISSGHDEYWSATQRTSMESARNAGVNLAFFTGNTGFWKTRWEPSSDGTSTLDRTLVTYKDTHFSAQQDPVEWTGTWRDPRYTTPADGVTPENALTGLSFLVNSGTTSITVPRDYGRLRMWRNTAAATLGVGQSLTLAPSTLGYEWDVDADNGFRPAGNIRLSSTTVSGLELFTDYGSTANPGGTATHNLTMYRAPSGARVFNSGTVQWAWGLDSSSPNQTPVDITMQQATVNLFADMGAQPFQLLPGLVGASASTDTTAPTSTIAAPPATVADGAGITITGTATDAGGGIVAGVEVSTDGGTTWHPATSGTSSWTYTWTAHGNPTATIRSRATDDSGNIETPGAGRTVGVTCPCSLWGTSVTPPDPDAGDPTPVEVGLKFRSDKFGTITGLRFYKAAANTGTHVGSLWNASGQRLAQANFTGESASGWQTVTFASPVEVLPDTTYVASYYAPNGHYAGTADYFWRAPAPGPNGGAVVDSAPLHAVTNVGTTLNGVFSYSPSSTFPVNSFGASNYWVDVLFTPAAVPGTVTNVTATAGGQTSANVSWSAPASGGAVTSYRITPYVGATAQTPRVISGSPPATSTTITGLTTGTTYTFRVEAVNPTGSGPASAPSNAVTPLVPVVPSAPTGAAAQPASQSALVSWTTPSADGDSPITGYRITPYIGATAQTTVQVGAAATSATVPGLTNGTAYTFRVAAVNAIGTGPASSASNAATPQATIFDFATPTTVDSQDNTPVELGVKFRADFSGTITGVRFYKSAANTGTHVGSLWTAAGSRLAQATFTGETGSGWQTVTFASPIGVTAGTTYVASYHAPVGRYSVTGAGLSGGADNGALHALPNSTSANGVYAYTSTPSTFPTSSYNAANYWVDVLYAVPLPGQVTNVQATEAGNTSANVTWSAPSSGGPATSYRVTPYIGTTAQTATVVTGSPAPTSTTVTGLTSGTTYTFRVQAVNANGAGALSAPSNAVTPSAPVTPSSPTNVAAQPAGQSARVTWTAPASDGDSPLTGHTVTPYIGAAAQTPTQVGAAATSATVSGLTNGTAYTFRVTASNAVGTSAASAASSAVTPRATIFEFATPSTIDGGENNALELGVKFRTDFSGSITGIRFYKSAANTGTHVGSLWTAAGARLAQATFSGESASGWQSVTFASPVAITAGTTYVASYHAPNGRYSVTSGGFSTAVTNGPLTALATATSTNGVFGYTTTPSTFPTSTFGAGNYWVDVLYAPAGAPGQVTGANATPASAAANVSWTAPASGGPPTSYQITPYIGATAQTPKVITGTPPATSTTVTGLTPGTAYTFTVQAINPSGSGAVSAPSNSVTPIGAVAPAAPAAPTAEADTKSALVSWSEPANDGGSPVTGYTITPFVGAVAQPATQVGATVTRTRITGLTNGTSYTFRVAATNAAGTSPASAASAAVTPRASLLELATPSVVDANDGSSVVIGVKFRADVAGTITGIRFYKAAANSGTHVGSLWTAAGSSLRQATFAGESASGWQTVTFASPVAITAGTTYVAAYLAPAGHYSVTGAAFGAGPLDNAPLHALADSESANGVYAYNATTVFPNNSWNASNYWVDVLFAPSA